MIAGLDKVRIVRFPECLDQSSMIPYPCGPLGYAMTHKLRAEASIPGQGRVAQDIS